VETGLLITYSRRASVPPRENTRLNYIDLLSSSRAHLPPVSSFSLASIVR